MELKNEKERDEMPSSSFFFERVLTLDKPGLGNVTEKKFVQYSRKGNTDLYSFVLYLL